MKQLKEALRSFGWSSYEASCYAALVKFGSLKASRIASETEISKSKVYQPLNDLEDQGYVRLVDNDPKVYEAQNPQYVMKQERREFQESSQQVLEKLQEAWEIQSELNDNDHSAWVARGQRGKNMELNNALEGVEESVCGFDVRLTHLPREVITQLEDFAKEDIDLQIVSGSQSLNQLKRLMKAGATVGLLTDIGRSSYYIVDGEKVVMTPSNGNSTLVFEDEDFARIIRNDFKNTLEEASEVAEE
jgi:sugar-specific transcriptional regulator TrmB